MGKTAVFHSVASSIMYVARMFGIWVVQIVSIGAAVAVGVIPILAVYWLLPFVWQSLANHSDGVFDYWEEIGFVALIGTLGIAPYLFSRSMALVSMSISGVASRLSGIAVGPWLPTWRQAAVFNLASQRVRTVASAAKSGVPLMVALVGVALAVQLALLVAGRGVTALATHDEPVSQVVSLRFDEGYGWSQNRVLVPSCPIDQGRTDAPEDLATNSPEIGGDGHLASLQHGPIEEVLVVGSRRVSYPSICFER